MFETDAKPLNRSPLYEVHKEMGADFEVSNGWEMPSSYSSPAEEHSKVRGGAGVVDLSCCGSIRVSGGEAVQFLNGLVTNNVKTLESGKGMRAAFLTGHGKVKALCRILNLGDSYLVINDPQTHQKVFKYLVPFSYAGDFKAEDVSNEYRVISVQGPNSLLVLKEVCFEPLPALSEHAWYETLIAGHRALVVNASHTGELGFDILAPASALKDVWDFILLKGSFHSIVPFGMRALDSLRIEAGVPVYGFDVDETNMMLETGLVDAVSFNKGCYTGQEAVAMATYRGHISKKLSGLMVSGKTSPNRGDLVSKDGKEIGFVTSALFSQTLGSVIALAFVKYGFFETGGTVQVQIGIEKVDSTIVELPFYKRN